MHCRQALVIALLLLAPVAAHAQQEPKGYAFLSSPMLIITMNPVNPAPGQTVEVTVSSPIADLADSVIRWSVGGSPLAEALGATSITTTAGALGTEKKIRVTADTGGGTVSADASIIPTEVDLLYDANSYVPPFYEGRALPSPSSQVRLHAVPRLVRPKGVAVAASDLLYTWKRNGATLASISGKGRSTATVPAPALFGADTISVDVATADRSLVGNASVRIPSVEPVLVFYEDSPLFGIRFRNALRAEDVAGGGELTIAAVPYFALAAGPNDPRLEYAWRVNGRTIAPDTARPDELTLSSGDGSGKARVDLTVTNATDLSMESRGFLQLTLSAHASGNAGTPGTSDTADDNPFRSQQ
jgi:hypothetical protein